MNFRYDNKQYPRYDLSDAIPGTFLSYDVTSFQSLLKEGNKGRAVDNAISH